MNRSNENNILINENELDMSFDQNRHFTVSDTCSLHYSEMIDHELNENKEYLTDSDSFSSHSCQNHAMDSFDVNNSHTIQKNCIAGKGHSPEYIHHSGHVDIRTSETTDFCCSHMGNDSGCLERMFTFQNTAFQSSQDIQLMDISSSNITELSVIQNQILPLPNGYNSFDPITSDVSKFSTVLTANVFYSKPEDIQDVSILENVYISQAIDYQSNRLCEANTIISHDGTVIATLQPMVSHGLNYDEVTTTVADDSFSHAMSPAFTESPLKEGVISSRREIDPRIKILLTMDTEDLDKALLEIPEIDVTGFRRLNVSSFDKLMKVKRASEPNFDPLIVEAIVRSPRKKASKASIFEYIIGNYELNINMRKAHNMFCDSMLSLLDRKIIYRKRGTGLRGLFLVTKDHLETLKKVEEKRESSIDFYTSDLEEYEMI